MAAHIAQGCGRAVVRAEAVAVAGTRPGSASGSVSGSVSAVSASALSWPSFAAVSAAAADFGGDVIDFGGGLLRGLQPGGLLDADRLDTGSHRGARRRPPASRQRPRH